MKCFIIYIICLRGSKRACCGIVGVLPVSSDSNKPSCTPPHFLLPFPHSS